MTSKGPEKPISSSESGEEVQQQNVISRVTNLPLVSSSYDMAVSAYALTKESHPYVKAVLDLAKEGMKQISDVAATGARPLLMKFEPQVSLADQYASMGLDKLEEKLPILHQTAAQVISDTQELVLSKVAGAKEAFTKAAWSSKEMVVETRMGKLALSGTEAMLEKSEELLDHFLPMTGEELAELAESAPVGVDTASENQGYFVRLGSLSSKLRHRAYQHAVIKVKTARDTMKEAFSQLHRYIGQIEHMKIEKTKEDVVQEGQENLSQVETQILDTSSHITQQLKRVFKNLIANIEGLPSNFQHNVQQAFHSMEELHLSFASARSFHGLSSSFLNQSQENVLRAQDYVENVLEYVVNNTPLSWLVGPLAPGLNQSGDVAEPTRPNDGQEKALKALNLKENL